MKEEEIKQVEADLKKAFATLVATFLAEARAACPVEGGLATERDSTLASMALDCMLEVAVVLARNLNMTHAELAEVVLRAYDAELALAKEDVVARLAKYQEMN